MISSSKRLAARVVQTAIGRSLPRMGEQVMQLAAYYPHSQAAYSVPVYQDQVLRCPAQSLSVPPQEPFWANYCTSVDSWIKSGADDIRTMRQVLNASGFRIEQSGKILELGVAGGRLIRHLNDLAPKTEIWGVDLWASAVRWCQEHLSPPFFFATTTVVLHLPFADQSFDLVYAGSVFTHLDDLAEAWFLELHRVLKQGGRLYFSINDRQAAKIFEGGGTPENRARYIERTGGEQSWQGWIDTLHNSPEYEKFLRGEAQMISIGRPGICHVLWDVDYLKRRIGTGWKWHSVTPEAYGHQTCVLLERR